MMFVAQMRSFFAMDSTAAQFVISDLTGIVLGKEYYLAKKLYKDPLTGFYIADQRSKSSQVLIKTVPIEDGKSLKPYVYTRLRAFSNKYVNSFVDLQVDSERGVCFFVCSKIEGYTLHHYVRESKLAIYDILTYASHILEGICALHESGLIHGRISNDTLIVDPNNPENLKVFGLGLSYVDNITSEVHEISSMFFPPNVEEKKQLLPSLDVFAIARVLLTLLTAEYEFDKKNEGNYQEVYLKAKEKLHIYGLDEVYECLVEATRSEMAERLSLYSLDGTIKCALKNLGKKFELPISVDFDFYTRYTESTDESRNAEINTEIVKSLSEGEGYVRVGLLERKASLNTLIIENMASKRVYKLLAGKNARSATLTAQSSFPPILKNKSIKLRVQPYIVGSKKSGNSEHLIQFLDQINKIKPEPKKKKKKSLQKQKEKEIKKTALEVFSSWQENLDRKQVVLVDNAVHYVQYSQYMYDKKRGAIQFRIPIYRQNKFLVKVLREKPIIWYNRKQLGSVMKGWEEKTEILIEIDLDESISEKMIQSIHESGELTIQDLGDKLNIEREQRALEELRQRTKYSRNSGDYVVATLKSPENAKRIEPISITDFYNPHLDSFQKDAVQRALGTEGIFLIQGPPGTGKTTVITELLLQILRINPQSRILVTSKSNTAVDNVIERISLFVNGKLFEGNILKVVRYGRPSAISQGALPYYSKSATLNWQQHLIKNGKEFLTRSTPGIEAGITKDTYERMTSIYDEWVQRFSIVQKDLENEYQYNAQIIGATSSGTGSGAFNFQDLDWVIMDEAGQANPTETLVPILKGKKVVLVGDHKQLPPYVNQKVLDNINAFRSQGNKHTEQSLFEWLYDTMPKENKRMLIRQYRMHPAIGDLVSKLSYDGAIKSDHFSGSDKQHNLPSFSSPIYWFTTRHVAPSHLAYHEQPPGENSYRNTYEAKIVRSLLHIIQDDCLQTNQTKSVGVITPYLLQTKFLETIIRPDDEEQWTKLDINIATVDGFQGQDRDIVIYTVVRNHPDGKLGFTADRQRVNVAISRAKELLIIVGNDEMAYTGILPSDLINPYQRLLDLIDLYRIDAQIKPAQEIVDKNLFG